MADEPPTDIPLPTQDLIVISIDQATENLHDNPDIRYLAKSLKWNKDITKAVTYEWHELAQRVALDLKPHNVRCICFAIYRDRLRPHI